SCNRRCGEVTAQSRVTFSVSARRRPAAQTQGLFRLTECQHRCFDGPTERTRQNPAHGYSEFVDGCSDRVRFASSLIGQVTLSGAVLEAGHALVALSKVRRGVTEIQDEAARSQSRHKGRAPKSVYRFGARLLGGNSGGE